MIMGRQLKDYEHNISGKVYVGRPLRSNFVLTGSLAEARKKNHLSIQQLKETVNAN